MAPMSLFASQKTQLTTVKEQTEHGEETPLNPMDTGSSIQIIPQATGSVTMVKLLEIGFMTMDLPLLELGGSKETALGSELGPLMSLMKPSSTITVIMDMKKNTPALISMMAQ